MASRPTLRHTGFRRWRPVKVPSPQGGRYLGLLIKPSAAIFPGNLSLETEALESGPAGGGFPGTIFRPAWVIMQPMFISGAMFLLILLGLPAVYILLTDGHKRYVHFLVFERKWRRVWNTVASLPGRAEFRLLRWGFLSPGLIEANVGDGVRMLLDPRDYVNRRILGLGEWDKTEFKWLHGRITPDGVFVDVGAHHGSYTLRIARLLNRGGMVLAIEPNPEAVSRLQENIRLNGLNNVRVQPVACGDHKGKVNLFVAAGNNTGMASLSAETAASSGPGGAARTYEVPIQPLDELTATLPGKRIFALKVDAEGAETMVLRGAAETIRTHRPVIVVETVPRQLAAMGSSLEELESLLQSYGYQKTAATSINALWEPRRQ